MSILRKEGKGGEITQGNENQNDMNCLQIIIKIVIPRDNFHFVRNFYVIFGRISKQRYLPNHFFISGDPDLKLGQADPSRTHKHLNLDKYLLVVPWPSAGRKSYFAFSFYSCYLN